MAKKPSTYVNSPGANKQSAAAFTAAAAKAVPDELVTSRFPTANPILPTIAADGTIIPAGHIAVPQEPGMGSGPGGTGATTPPPPTGPPATPPLDWHAYLTNWGFDQSIVDELDRIFRTYSDSNAAASAGLAYIRGTDWYTKTFPGITEGLQKGLVSNEADYRAYTNQLNEIYQRYYGRNVTGADVSNTLKAGYNAGRVEKGLQGAAYISANRGDLQQLSGAFGDTGQLKDNELQAYGEQQSGLDSFLGEEVQRRLAIAQRRFQGVFQGVLASPALSLTKFGRLSAPSLSGGINQSDVGA